MNSKTVTTRQLLHVMLLVMQMLFVDLFESILQISPRIVFGDGKILIKIVSAFFRSGSGDLACIGGDEGKALLHQADGVGIGYRITQQEIEPGAAAHRTDIDNGVRKGAVACIGGEKMLDGFPSNTISIFSFNSR